MAKRGGDAEHGRIIRRTYPLANIRILQEGSTPPELDGLASVYNSYSESMWGFKEIVRPGTFAVTIVDDDIRCLFNHEASLILGRNTAKTLTIDDLAEGLHFRNPLPDTSYAKDLAVSIDRGDVTQCSFSFEVNPGGERWTTKFFEDGDDLRELLSCKLYDLGPVTFPAYTESHVGLRELRSVMGAVGMDLRTLAPALGRAEHGLELRADDLAAIRESIDQLRGLLPPEAGQGPESGDTGGDTSGQGPSVTLLRRSLELAEAEFIHL